MATIGDLYRQAARHYNERKAIPNPTIQVKREMQQLQHIGQLLLLAFELRGGDSAPPADQSTEERV